MHIHSEHFSIRYHETGLDQLVRVPCICNYIEEAAGNHAVALGVGMQRLAEENLAWVLAKMRLCLFRRPGPGEHLRVDTWPVHIEGLRFRRDVLMYDEAGMILASAVTEWLVMNRASRRIERFPAYVAALPPDNPPHARKNADIRIPALELSTATGPRFTVRLADIDQNLHVNNGRYVDFSLEAAYAAGMRGDLRQIDLIFRSESRYGQTIASRTREENEGAAPGLHSFLHSLVREEDGQELVRARTVWAD